MSYAREELERFARDVNAALGGGAMPLARMAEMVEGMRESNESLSMALCDAAGEERKAREECATLRGQLAFLQEAQMPEHMRWPRYEDGEIVRIGALFHGNSGENLVADEVTFKRCNFCNKAPHGWVVTIAQNGNGNASLYFEGERVKRPRPKVLDADGVEIHVGDTLYTRDGTEVTVIPCPVEGSVHELSVRYEDGTTMACVGDALTHEKPDSWERFKRDLADALDDTSSRAYAGPIAVKFTERARALAGRGRQ